MPLSHVANAGGTLFVTERAGDQVFGADGQSMEVVARLCDGDREALAVIYEAHHAAVRGFAQRMVGDVTVAEDLVHEAFLALPKAARRFRGEASLRSFILGVALNCARHYVRAAARRRKAMARLAARGEIDHAAEAPTADSPAHALERRRLAQHLWRALDTLSLDHRAVFVLSEIEQRSAAEVAALMKTTEGTVRSRLFYAKRKLRALLEETEVAVEQGAAVATKAGGGV